jgi:hypothetical protein
MLRFSVAGDESNSHVMKVVDISMSGMAFVVDRDKSPFIFDRIKVEIPLKDNQQVAWWAKVTRIEEYAPHKWYMRESDFPDDSQVLIGVHFDELPPAHAKAIHEAITERFKNLETERRAEYVKAMAWFFAKNTWLIAFYVAFTAAVIWMISSLAKPSENYSAEKGAPWGRRFFYIEKPVKKENPKWDNADAVKRD